MCSRFSLVCPFLRGRKCSVAVSLRHYYVIYVGLRMSSSMILAIENGERVLPASLESARI